MKTRPLQEQGAFWVVLASELDKTLAGFVLGQVLAPPGLDPAFEVEEQPLEVGCVSL